MSLPFLKRRKIASLIMAERKPSGAIEMKLDDEENSPLEAAAADLQRAMGMKDNKMIANALRSAFQILDAEPHQEGEHTEDMI